MDDNYKEKYFKYKTKYLNLKNQIGGSDVCLKNYQSSLTEKGKTGKTDCWADAGIFLLFGNPRLRNLILDQNTELKKIFDENLKGDVIDFEMRNKLLKYFGIKPDDLSYEGAPYKFIFDDNIQQIITSNGIKFEWKILNPDINKIINIDSIDYKLHSCSVLNHNHFISIFNCNNKWYVADNTVPNLVDYDLESGYTPKAESFDETIIGKNYNLKENLEGFYLYLRDEVEPRPQPQPQPRPQPQPQPRPPPRPRPRPQPRPRPRPPNNSGRFYVIVYSKKDIPIEQLKTELEKTYGKPINIINNPDVYDSIIKIDTDDFLNKKENDKATKYNKSTMLKLIPFEGIEKMNDSILTEQENKLEGIVKSLGYRLIEGHNSDKSWGGKGLWGENQAIIPLIYE